MSAKNMQGTLPKPQQIFKHASGFLEAAARLRERGDLGANVTNIPPLLVLEAFTIELLLKCLLAREGKQPPRHHLLDKLFDELSDERQCSIISKWDKVARPRLQTVSKQLGLPVDLPAALAECNKGFEYVRYGYEEPDRMRFYLGDLPAILLNEIAELEPDWIKWVGNP